jgi:RNase P/RNase MRP subunit p29
MAKKENAPADLVVVQPEGDVTVLPPNSGIVGRFIAETENMFKAQSHENEWPVAENQ